VWGGGSRLGNLRKGRVTEKECQKTRRGLAMTEMGFKEATLRGQGGRLEGACASREEGGGSGRENSSFK